MTSLFSRLSSLSLGCTNNCLVWWGLIAEAIWCFLNTLSRLSDSLLHRDHNHVFCCPVFVYVVPILLIPFRSFVLYFFLHLVKGPSWIPVTYKSTVARTVICRQDGTGRFPVCWMISPNVGQTHKENPNLVRILNLKCT